MASKQRRKKKSKRFLCSLKLVASVQQFPILYDNEARPKKRGKRDFGIREAWAKVSHEMGVGKDVCRKLWFQIRGYYANCLKHGRRYSLADALDFLKPFMNAKTQKKSNDNTVGSRSLLKFDREMEINLQECVEIFNEMDDKKKVEVKMRIGIVKEEKNRQKSGRAMPQWTETQKRNFIRTVEMFPVVFDNSGTAEEEDVAWKAIAELSNSTPTICRRKWRWFRVTFSRSLPDRTRKYRFYDDLQFLKPYVYPVNKKPNVYSSNDSDEDSSFCEDHH